MSCSVVGSGLGRAAPGRQRARGTVALLVALVFLAALQAPGQPSAGLEDRLARASAAFARGDWDAAEAHYRAALPEMAQAPSLLLKLAETSARRGRGPEALSWLERAAALGIGGIPPSLEGALGTPTQATRWRAVRARLARNREPLARGVVAFTLAERDLIPESVAFDPVDGAFYVGSLRKRKIVRVERSGHASDLVPTARDGLWAVVGMKLHPTRRELWANACSVATGPPMQPAEPESDGSGALFRFGLPDGRLLGRYSLSGAAQRVCFNDLVFAANGSAYLSSGPDGIYQLAPGAEPLRRLVAYDGIVNGIAASDDGRYLFLADQRRGVVRLEPATGALLPLGVPPQATLAGIDGLYVRGRTLAGIQNGLAGVPERALQAWLDPGLGRAECVAVLDRAHPAFDIPTTGVLVGSELYYVASSQLSAFGPAQAPAAWERLHESTVLRTPLLSTCPGAPVAPK